MPSSPPAVVVLALGRALRLADREPRPAAGDAAVLVATIDRALATELPVIVVTTDVLAPAARSRLAGRDVLVLPGRDGVTGMDAGAAIASGVAARGDASGWVLLSGDLCGVQPATIAAVARALDEHPVAYAQHGGRRGEPVGFAAELYSELVRLDGDDAARRLVARYPSIGVDVDDPATLGEPGDGVGAAWRPVQGGVAATLER